MANPKYEKIIAIATTVSIVLLGIAFIICTAHLYFTGGEQPYSRERVGEYLLILAIPSAITIGLAVAGIVIRIIKEKESVETSSRTQSEILEAYAARYDLSKIDGELGDVIRKERLLRDTFKSIAYVLSALIFVLIIVYICFFAEFTVENLNDDVIAALAVVLPFAAIAMGIHVPRLYVAETSCKTEINAIKAYQRTNKLPKADSNTVDAKETKTAIVVRVVIATVAIAFIVLGIFNGGVKDVLAKGVKICTECIGLG